MSDDFVEFPSLVSYMFDSRFRRLPASAFDSDQVLDAWIASTSIRPTQESIMRVFRDDSQVLPATLSPVACKLVIEKLGNTYGSAVLAGTQNDQVRFDAALSHKYKSVRLAALWNPLASFELLLDNMSDVVMLPVEIMDRHPGFLPWLLSVENHVKVSNSLSLLDFDVLDDHWRKDYSVHKLRSLWQDSKIVKPRVKEVDLDVPTDFLSKGFILKAAKFLVDNRVKGDDLLPLIATIQESHPRRTISFVDKYVDVAQDSAIYLSDENVADLYVAAFNAGASDPALFSVDSLTIIVKTVSIPQVLDVLAAVEHKEAVIRDVLERNDVTDLFLAYTDRFFQDFDEASWQAILKRWIVSGLFFGVWDPVSSGWRYNIKIDTSNVAYASVIADMVAVLNRLDSFAYVYDTAEIWRFPEWMCDEDLHVVDDALPLLEFVAVRPFIASAVFEKLSVSQAVDVLNANRHSSASNVYDSSYSEQPFPFQFAAHPDACEIISRFMASGFNELIVDTQRRRARLLSDTLVLMLLNDSHDRIQVRELFSQGFLCLPILTDVSINYTPSSNFRGYHKPDSVKRFLDMISASNVDTLLDVLTFLAANGDVSILNRQRIGFVNEILIALLASGEDFSPRDALFVSGLFQIPVKDLSLRINYVNEFKELTQVALCDEPAEVWDLVASLSSSWQGSLAELLEFAGCDLDKRSKDTVSTVSDSIDDACDNSQLSLM